MPGIVVTALRGGAGKTIFSVGIIAALCRQGMQAAPFKKGPDYIDAGWLALAAGRPCYNLDTFLIDSQTIIQSMRPIRHMSSVPDFDHFSLDKAITNVSDFYFLGALKSLHLGYRIKVIKP